MKRTKDALDDKATPKADEPWKVPPLLPPKQGAHDPPTKGDSANSEDGTGSEGSGEPIQKPPQAFWGNLTDPFNNTTIPHRAKNVFAYGEAIGRTLSGWRVKALSFLFTPSNATKIEIAATRGTIRGIGKGFVFVAPLAAIVDLVDVFRKNKIGTGAFYQNYGMAGLGAIGGILGGAAFDAFGFGILASLGLSGIGVFVIAPLLFGLVGAGVFQWVGANLNQQTQPGSFLYNWYPGSFLDRCVSAIWSWFSGTGEPSNIVSPDGKNRSRRQAPGGPSAGASSPQLPDNWSSRRRPPPRMEPLLPPWRGGPGGGADASGGGEEGPDSGAGDEAGNNGGGATTRSSRRVGGVLFENCHTVLTGIEELTGAYWDENTQSVVLIGKDAADRKKQAIPLPAMDADHLKVAIRAALIGESLGVSIDAPAEYRYDLNGHRMPPAGTPFFVSYLGGSAATLSGAIFFEADRIMKCLSIGIDNETKESFQAKVPGFRSTFDLHNRQEDSRAQSWHRFWFVVEHVEIKRCAQTNALTFGEVRIAVKTELELHGSEPGREIDPLDVQFAQHLTLHYDEYAKEFPIFARLKELAKVSALASYLVNQETEIDLGDILSTPPVEVLTPDTTPSLLRSKSKTNGNIVHTQMMSGGVDMRTAPQITEDFDGLAARMRQSAGSNRSTFVQEWPFQIGKASLFAKAVRLGPVRKFRLVEQDHRFPAEDSLLRLELQRIYESSHTAVGMFGPGWNILLPYSLKILNASGKRREVLNPKSDSDSDAQLPIIALRNGRNGKTQIYRPLTKVRTNGNLTWGRLTSLAPHQNNGSFHYDPKDTISRQSDRYLLEANGRNYYFDDSGRLVEISSRAGTFTRYVWEGCRLLKVEDSGGNGYSFQYDEAFGQVKAVQTPKGDMISYVYGSDRRLCKTLIGSQCLSSYAYDMSGRLNEVTDSTGTVTHRAYYNTNGEFVSDTVVDTLDLPDGGQIKRVFSDDRLTSFSDQLGTRVEFTYGLKGNIQAVFIKNRAGLNWRLDYDSGRRLRRIVDSVGRATEFTRDGMDEVVQVTLPNGQLVRAKRDDSGRIVEMTASGSECKAIFDAANFLTSITGPGGTRIDFKYTRGIVASLNIIGGTRTPTFAIGPDCTVGSAGTRHRFPFSSPHDEKLSGRRLIRRHRIKCTLGADARTLTTEGPAGIVKLTPGTSDSATELIEFLP